MKCQDVHDTFKSYLTLSCTDYDTGNFSFKRFGISSAKVVSYVITCGFSCLVADIVCRISSCILKRRVKPGTGGSGAATAAAAIISSAPSSPKAPNTPPAASPSGSASSSAASSGPQSAASPVLAPDSSTSTSASASSNPQMPLSAFVDSSSASSDPHNNKQKTTVEGGKQGGQADVNPISEHQTIQTPSQGKVRKPNPGAYCYSLAGAASLSSVPFKISFSNEVKNSDNNIVKDFKKPKLARAQRQRPTHKAWTDHPSQG